VALAKAVSDARLGLVVVVSDGGEAANLLTKYRPSVPVVVVTSSPPVAAQREVYFGQVGAADVFREKRVDAVGKVTGARAFALSMISDEKPAMTASLRTPFARRATSRRRRCSWRPWAMCCRWPSRWVVKGFVKDLFRECLLCCRWRSMTRLRASATRRGHGLARPRAQP
jgi:hypothetical protein